MIHPADAGSLKLLTSPKFISQSVCKELIAAFDYVSANGGAAGGHIRKWPYRTAISTVLLRDAGVSGLAERLDRVRQEAADAVTGFYGISQPAYIDYTLMSEMKFGDCIPAHADSEEQDNDGAWRPNHTPYHYCAAVLYLNGSGVDYEGGRLRFCSTQQEIIPQTGLLAGFLSSRDYEHEVTVVQSGCRYSISIWMTLDPARTERWPALPARISGEVPAPGPTAGDWSSAL